MEQIIAKLILGTTAAGTFILFLLGLAKNQDFRDWCCFFLLPLIWTGAFIWAFCVVTWS